MTRWAISRVISIRPQSYAEAKGVWVVEACFNEQDVITRFVARVLAVPGVDQLVLIDDRAFDEKLKVFTPGCSAPAPSIQLFL